MPCPHCAATVTAEQPRRTALGYRTFRCSTCRRIFNERTGTAFNHLQYPTDLVLLVVLWRLRYKLSLRDLAEMFLARGLAFSHEAVRDWEARFAPLLAAHLRAKRRGTVSVKWHADETYSKVNGRWCYLYRAIDREGNLVDALLCEKRDMAAVQRFFTQALEVAGRTPEQVTTDGHDAYPAPFGRPWDQASAIATAATRTIGSSRITGASSNATTRCAASVRSTPPRASALPSRNSVSTSAPKPGRTSASRWRSAAAASRRATPPSWPRWPPLDQRPDRSHAAHTGPCQSPTSKL